MRTKCKWLVLGLIVLFTLSLQACESYESKINKKKEEISVLNMHYRKNVSENRRIKSRGKWVQHKLKTISDKNVEHNEYITKKKKKLNSEIHKLRGKYLKKHCDIDVNKY